MRPEPASLTPSDIVVGLKAGFERDVSEEDIEDFAAVSGDHNPLHVDGEYARTTSYGRRIAHGAYQVGLASTLVGMHLPGRNALVGNYQAKFLAPLCFPTRVSVSGAVTAWNQELASGRLLVTVVDLAAGSVTAEVAVTVAFYDSCQKSGDTPSRRTDSGTQASRHGDDRPLLLVTGAAGGIGRDLTATLLEDYRVVAITSRSPLPQGLASDKGLSAVAFDLVDGDWSALKATLDGSLYGILHQAWPSASKGGLLSAPDAVVQRHVAFGSTVTINLARLLWDTCGPQGGRLIVLGSDAGGRRPQLGMSAYSLGKAALEHTMQLLAGELAAKNITANVVAPNVVPVGMNQNLAERQLLAIKSQVPLGRLCAPEDIAGSVRFLLSPASSFISGQVLPLTGAQL